MLRTPRRRAVLLAAGALIVALAACDSGDPDDAGKDLAGNRAGAMAQYKVGDQFTATEPLSFSILYNNHPNYPLNENWLMWTELTKRTNVKLEPVAVRDHAVDLVAPLLAVLLGLEVSAAHEQEPVEALEHLGGVGVVDRDRHEDRLAPTGALQRFHVRRRRGDARLLPALHPPRLQRVRGHRDQRPRSHSVKIARSCGGAPSRSRRG